MRPRYPSLLCWQQRKSTAGWLPGRRALAWCLVDALRRLARLLRHPAFRRLVAVRLLSQSGDAVVQVGMAAYILFSPQSQADAWAIAAVIALVMLPFSVVGPFVSPILDRFPRQRIVVVCDLTRLLLSIVTFVVVVSGGVAGSRQFILYGLLLLILGLNRLQLAALGAGMPHTVAANEYLEAAAIMPMLGPLSGMVGGLLAGGLRLAAGRMLPAGWAGGLLFLLAAVMFAGSALVAARFGGRRLGPRAGAVRSSWADVWTGLSVGVRELWLARPAFTGVSMVFGARVGYGLLMTMVILLYRHHFGSDENLESVMVQMGVWFLASGAGFALSGLLVTPVAARFGVRFTLLVSLAAASAAQLIPTGAPSRPALLVAGFLLGLCLQSVKICGDTVVQAHIGDRTRGRVMVIYDIINNLGFVVGAVVAAATLPPDGVSSPAMFALAAGYLLLAALFAVLSRGRAASYNRGTVLAEGRHTGNRP